MRQELRTDLAGYAMRVEESRGRRHPETSHPYRNDYERDRDRIIHSRAFRRLENKTQVFARRFSDHFRNRLTHTLEVSQISRTVARVLHLNTDLVEALALVHDVGHPPFGHAGEAVLSQFMERFQDRFDHNLHALRIVEEFEQKYTEFPGLNLTYEVREGIVKHSRPYDPALYPDLREYNLEEQPPLEAQLINCADEIAYNCADLDDGYESKLLTIEQIREGVPLFESLYRPLERKYPTALEKLKFNEALKRLMDALVTDLIETTRQRLEKLKVNTVAQVRAQATVLAGPSSPLVRTGQSLKDFLSRNLYAHPHVDAERRKVARRLERLFDYFVAHPRSLPPSYYAKAQQQGLHRIVCDYIAGMTDNYLSEQYRKHLGD